MYWRQAGLNYLQYSKIAAKVLRDALKVELRVEGAKREGSTVKITQWKDGRPASKTAEASA